MLVRNPCTPSLLKECSKINWIRFWTFLIHISKLKKVLHIQNIEHGKEIKNDIEEHNKRQIAFVAETLKNKNGNKPVKVQLKKSCLGKVF